MVAQDRLHSAVTGTGSANSVNIRRQQGAVGPTSSTSFLGVEVDFGDADPDTIRSLISRQYYIADA